MDMLTVMSGEELMRQAVATAQHYMICAVEDINKQFGAGYAAKHPELVAAYMQTAALDYGGSIIARELGKAATQD